MLKPAARRVFYWYEDRFRLSVTIAAPFDPLKKAFEMLPALFNHFVLLVKGRHDLRGLPVSMNLSFLFLLIPALVADGLMHVLVMDESAWLVLVTLTISLLMARFWSCAMVSAVLILVLFSSLFWIVLSSIAGYFDVRLPYALYLTLAAILILRQMLFWLKRGIWKV